MIKNFLKYSIVFLTGAILAATSIAAATTLFPSQGGTGFSTTTAANVGSFLQVVSTTPLRYTFGTTSVSGSGTFTTTTITVGGTTLSKTAYTIATSGQSGAFLTTSGGDTIIFNMATATLFVNGYLSAVDFTTFNNKQNDLNGAYVASLGAATGTIGLVQNLTMSGNNLNTIQDIMTTSSPTFASTTLTGQLNVTTFISYATSAQPTIANDGRLLVHNFQNGAIPRLEADSIYTVNGCDVVNRDNCVIVKNNQGSSITIGQAVYVNGASGANPTVKLAQADATTTAVTLGLVASTSVANNGFTYVMTKGILSNVDTSAFAAGDVLFLSTSVAGGLQTARATFPNVVNRIGTVLVSNANTGQILVEVASFVGGQETGTISPTFNINGANALTSSTLTNFITAGSGISISTSATGTITVSSTVSGGTPGGADTNVQFNNGGNFSGTSTFVFASTSNQLSLTNASSAMLIGASSSFSTGPTTAVSFAKTGASTTWTVPSGVTSITITAKGAGTPGGTYTSSTFGGVATGTIAVTPGTVLYINVAGAPADPTAGNVAGGYGGGGPGATSTGDSSRGSSGGGGMTYVGLTPDLATSSAIIIGSGAGGSGSQFNGAGGRGGDGGGVAGHDGANGSGAGGAPNGSGGTGGTQTTSGTGGAGDPAGGNGNSPTSTYSGGEGYTTTRGGGGGGGAGYHGGGAGGGSNGSPSGGGGGGGGSSFVTSTMTATSTASSTNTGNGSLIITYKINSYANYSSAPYSLAVGGHEVFGGPAPTVANCGSNPTLQGSDSIGVITTGSGTVNSCNLVFAISWSSAPICIPVTGATGSYAAITTATATGTIFSFSASTPSTNVYYRCAGF